MNAADESGQGMVLRTSLTSPFGRKVRMAACALGLSDRIVIEPADTTDPADSLMRQNPLGKIPCLVLADGTSVYDSRIIVEYLQELAGSEAMVPLRGAERIAGLVAASLADGIIDAGAIVIYEMRYHAEEARSQRWLEAQYQKIWRALDRFETSAPDARRTDIASIGLACALGFLDKRAIVDWRGSHPGLVRWLDAFAEAEPAFALTRPPANA